MYLARTIGTSYAAFSALTFLLIFIMLALLMQLVRYIATAFLALHYYRTISTIIII